MSLNTIPTIKLLKPCMAEPKKMAHREEAIRHHFCDCCLKKSTIAADASAGPHDRGLGRLVDRRPAGSLAGRETARAPAADQGQPAAESDGRHPQGECRAGAELLCHRR